MSSIKIIQQSSQKSHILKNYQVIELPLSEQLLFTEASIKAKKDSQSSLLNICTQALFVGSH